MAATTIDPVRVRRVFELELARECDNRSVVGGLDRMFIQMVEDGALPPAHPLRESLRDLTHDGGYRGMSAEARRKWLLGAMDRLDRMTGTVTRRPTPSGDHRLLPSSHVTELRGVSEATAKKLEKLGIETVGHLAAFFPRRFNDFSDMKKIRDLVASPAPQTIVCEVRTIRPVQFGRRMRGTEALLADGTGVIRAIWFNGQYIARQVHAGDGLVVSGKVRMYRGRLQMEGAEFEAVDADLMHTGRLVPVYPATQGIGQRTLRRIIKTAVDAVAADIPDPVPPATRRERHLPPLVDAIRAYHYPASTGEAEEARQRLALGELLAIQTAVLTRRAEWQREVGAPALDFSAQRDAFEASLPFALTGAQQRCLGDIHADILGPQPMLRLLQGDVGSGKTVVALEAMMAAVANGWQAAMMAPTEILAEQHYRSMLAMLGGEGPGVFNGVVVPPWLGRPIRVVLITGSLTGKQKEQMRSDAAHGGADIIIGTHALLEADVQIPRLGLAVVDEQHRFGVMQRAKLRQKGTNPHLLVMTATPIPRTLALTVYGDLEVSTLDELPPGRKPVKTTAVAPVERDEAYGIVRERLDAGEQVFVICPLVEESDTLDVRSAEEEYERLRNGPLREYRLDLLHGRMPGRQKDDVMQRFAAHETDVLVSTSVVEVGVDVPNATVIIIEGAERFGLSQLHQFRGRVGRSAKQSYCFLFSTEEEPGPEARQRLDAMTDYNDGFRLAEVDLEMRGEGEVWGKLQSGANTMLRVARFSDRDVLLDAREMARGILAIDPELERPEHQTLREMAEPILGSATEAN